MARCNCAGQAPGGCNCALLAGENVTVTGTGQSADPWVINAPTPEQLAAGPGIEIVDGAIQVHIADDLSNQLEQTVDGLFVPPGSGGSYLASVAYTTVGSFNFLKAAYPGVKWVKVRLVGGGGGGAGATAAASNAIARGGGAGGGYGEIWVDADVMPASVQVDVGAGGAGGGSANVAGRDGQDSAFGSYIYVRGGGGAPATGSTGSTSGFYGSGAPVGLGSGGIQLLGERGGVGIVLTGSSGNGGVGGTSGMGFGAGGRGGIAGGQGSQGGNAPGGGGGGGLAVGTSGAAGAAGGRGAVYLELYAG